ncbi:hypothetical protein A0H81_05759 [Grifola frondosa]|uniref:Digeranylgeranylglyceryl phosphate synthase n=1 Tax=Grifola frondosa TaxID=5627 RepID=A0A1C7MC54_GRIFR|nr:hypothetical protein A0H81_05759 [Grifola frondosa]
MSRSFKDLATARLPTPRRMRDEFDADPELVFLKRTSEGYHKTSKTSARVPCHFGHICSSYTLCLEWEWVLLRVSTDEANLLDARSPDLADLLFVSCSFARRHLYIALLFTWTDYKTIFLPITAFACATAPLHSFRNLLHGWVWIWFHLLMCNVSNQSKTELEDAINRAWRPLPSGRIRESQARILRWTTVVLCFLLSSAYSVDMVMVTSGLVLTTILYDDAGLAWNAMGKNLCNIGGYTTFEIGAMKIMGSSAELDEISISAVMLSGIMIFTTIQAQDFADVEGDAALGRMTFPIYAPTFSRVFTLIAILAWSTILSWYWSIGIIGRTIFIALGFYVGLRYYCWRTPNVDKRSYIVYSVWLILAHILPLQARIDASSHMYSA